MQCKYNKLLILSIKTVRWVDQPLETKRAITEVIWRWGSWVRVVFWIWHNWWQVRTKSFQITIHSTILLRPVCTIGKHWHNVLFLYLGGGSGGSGGRSGAYNGGDPSASSSYGSKDTPRGERWPSNDFPQRLPLPFDSNRNALAGMTKVSWLSLFQFCKQLCMEYCWIDFMFSCRCWPKPVWTFTTKNNNIF